MRTEINPENEWFYFASYDLQMMNYAFNKKTNQLIEVKNIENSFGVITMDSNTFRANNILASYFRKEIQGGKPMYVTITEEEFFHAYNSIQIEIQNAASQIFSNQFS